MRAVMFLFDTLTRKYLPNYGCDWVQMPNFKRLDNHCTKFNNFYAGSLPCMPARRELHTGKYNFLHRGWGPLEPFDRSVMEVLRLNGVYTHLCTDHAHYWEDGGATYHNRYDTWQGFRGQEGDRLIPHDIKVSDVKRRNELNKFGLSVDQHYRNRLCQQTEEEMSGTKTVKAGLEFLREHVDKDSWFLQIECFDPHEPFYVPQKYRNIYGLPQEETVNWPRYGMVPSGDYHKDLENAAKEYVSLMTMCDARLGEVLDFMDTHDMWKDTMLIVNTDHGFLLGEHNCMGKNFSPMYDELVHLPFFLHLPGQEKGTICDELAATVDVVPTLLEYFNCDPLSMGEMDGHSLLPAVEGEKIRDFTLFGIHGSYTCCTDGHKVYMKTNVKDENLPLYEYTLMPTNIRNYFSKEQLIASELVAGSRFTNGIPCLRMPAKSFFNGNHFGDYLYDLEADPKQKRNIINEENARIWNAILAEELKKVDAPTEEMERLGL